MTTPAKPTPADTGDLTSFATDIRPLFRSHDRSSMSEAFDLWSHDDVVTHQDAIAERLHDGSMPCDGPWTAQKIAVFDRWMKQGSRP